MTPRRIVQQLLILVATVTSVAAPALAQTVPPPAPDHPRPASAEVLFWPQAKREANFPHMEAVFPVHVVKRGAAVHPLPPGKPLDIAVTLNGAPEPLAQFMEEQKTAGVLVIQNGRIRAEQYNLGYGPMGRWTSFSVAKSFTSTLVGAAIKDGYIQSLDDPVTRYIPGLKSSAYEGISIRQLLTMTSGVKWNEDYTDPKSDVARLFSDAPDPGLDPTVSYMRKLPRQYAPGTRWVYKTGETSLIGVLVTSATHKSLAAYLSEKLWRPYGMEQDAAWMIDARGQESGGCCLSVSLHDYGRMGLFILGGGRAGGREVLPDDWIAAATHKQVDTGEPGQGYGYQWWTNDDGTVDARGIFGQAIHIDQRRKLVVVVSSAWAHATDPVQQKARAALFDAIARAADADPQPGANAER